VVVVVLLVAVLLAGLRRASTGGRSIERHRRAMDALDELSKRNQASWPGEALTPVPPALTSVALTPGQPPQTARGHFWGAAGGDGGFFQTPRRFVPITLMVAAVLTAAGLALAESIHSPQVIRQGTPHSPGPTGTSVPAASSSSTTLPATTTSSTPPPNTTSGLVLEALSPGAGSAGQQVTLSGSGFIGAHGYIAATFDGVVVPTRCPSEQTCIVTIPAGHSGDATVRLRTSTGESNALVFRFEPSHVS
jgi:hypothetical protein